MNVAHLLEERAAVSGGEPALLQGEQILTFAGLARAAEHAAVQLRTAGVEPGQVVLVLVPMSVELYVALNALLRLGAIAMFLDPSAGRPHIDSCCSIRPPQAFVGSPRAHLLRLACKSLRQIPIQFCVGRGIWGAPRLDTTPPDTNRNEARARIEPCSAETPALIRFTSGSTGEPKAAVRTHGFLREQQRVIERSFRLVTGEMDLATMPMFILANLASGVSSVIPPGDWRAPGEVDPGPVLRCLQARRPHRISASPAFLERLADFCAGKAETLPSLEKIFTGGAPVFPYLLDKLQAMAPRAEITAVYGSTEAEPISQINRADLAESDLADMRSGKGLLAGWPDPAIQVRILGEEMNRTHGPITQAEFQTAWLPCGQPGEILVSGPHVQPGYWQGRGEAETKLRVDDAVWHRTGDAGYLDARGRLWLLGRQSARVRDERGTLYPFQVECAAAGHPAVRRAALVAHQGRRWLAVEPRRGAAIPDLASSLAWAGLDGIRLLRLPVDPRHNAKIDYTALQRLL